MEAPGAPPPQTPVRGTVAGWTVTLRARTFLLWTWSSATVELGPTHLHIRGHARHGSQRIPWERVSPPRRVADSRDTWTQAFFSSLHVDAPDHPDPVGDRPRPALSLRWTTDDRPAKHAHELTEWTGMFIGQGWTAPQLDWLENVILHAQAVADAARRDQEFDQAVRGQPDAAAHRALTELIDDRD